MFYSQITCMSVMDILKYPLMKFRSFQENQGYGTLQGENKIYMIKIIMLEARIALAKILKFRCNDQSGNS